VTAAPRRGGLPELSHGARRRYRDAGVWSQTLLDEYLDAAAARRPERTAVVDGDVRLSYAEVSDRVTAAAAGLHRLGAARGEVVSFQLPNWWEALVIHLATIRIGAVSNPLMPILRERELRYALGRAGSRVFVCPATFRGFDHRDLALRLRRELAGCEHVVLARGAHEDALSFGELLTGSTGVGPEPSRDADDPVLLLYTSGTESDPKGAVHSHATVDYEDRSMISRFGLTSEDVVWMPSPVAHITGVLYGFHLATMLTTTVVYQDVWDPGEALRLIETERVSVVIAATPFLHGLVHHPELAAYDVSSLRVFGCGGADVPPELIRQAEDRLGCLAVRIYGSTEIPTLTTGASGHPPGPRAETDGTAVAPSELRVLDEGGLDVPAGTSGRLAARGPDAFLGYLGADESPFDANGWFDTGDRGRVDQQGYLTVTGRSKDIIVRGGENISAKEVEDLLYTHPEVIDVAVVAVPDPRLAERACAVVVPREGARPSLDDLTSFLNTTGIARQKYPERLELVAELPRNPTGKVQKFRLRERLAEQAS
jgi:cyclohexanecarboxylate-CoA ligase